MLSVQGLIIMFMFGVATTLTITAMWLFYTEYKLNQQRERRRKKASFQSSKEVKTPQATRGFCKLLPSASAEGQGLERS